jgi:hypothetical protein
MITWWVQLVESTPIENHVAVAEVLSEYVNQVEYHSEMRWGGGTCYQCSIAGEAVPLVITEILNDIQPLLGAHERMIFTRMVEQTVFDRAAVEYFIVTKAMVATFSGQALIQRARYMSRIAEETLEKAQDSFDGISEPE